LRWLAFIVLLIPPSVATIQIEAGLSAEEHQRAKNASKISVQLFHHEKPKLFAK
jgi:hypothetical protein